MSVLVLSEECDPTADAVGEALDHRGARVHRVDLGWFPTRLDVDADLGTEAGWTGALRVIQEDHVDLVRPRLSCGDAPPIKIAE